MIHKKFRTRLAVLAAVICMGAVSLTAGCGSTAQQKSSAVSVKAMKVLQQDTSVSHDYSGQIKSMDAVVIKPKVSGSIVEKYFQSGQPVTQGQALYKIDDRQYESEVLSARSNVDKARTALNNSIIDLDGIRSSRLPVLLLNRPLPPRRLRWHRTSPATMMRKLF